MPYSPVIDLNGIKNGIAAFIAAVAQQTAQGDPTSTLKLTWAFAWQKATKPLKPYCIFKITGPRKIGGLDEIRQEPIYLKDNDGNQVYDDQGNPVVKEYVINKEGEREYTVSLECASDDETGPMLATSLLAALEQPQYVGLIEQNGLYAVRGIPMDIQDVTALIQDGTKYERRMVLDFYLAAVSSVTYDPGGLITQVQGQILGTPPDGADIQIPLDAGSS